MPPAGPSGGRAVGTWTFRASTASSFACRPATVPATAATCCFRALIWRSAARAEDARLGALAAAALVIGIAVVATTMIAAIASSECLLLAFRAPMSTFRGNGLPGPWLLLVESAAESHSSASDQRMLGPHSTHRRLQGILARLAWSKQ